MGAAIQISVTKAPQEYDLGASKFFGAPTLPEKWENDFYDDEMFLCQIRLSDIAHLDPENKLPHTGYLYIFLHTDGGYYGLEADVRYYDGEPTIAVDDFNLAVPDYERFNETYLMHFGQADEDADGTKLFGIPSDWNYETSAPKLLMQFDPLDSEMGFLDFLDGYLYFFFGEDEKDLSAVTLLEEYS